MAGALMEVDDEGFMTLDLNGDARHGARNVVNFGQVRGGTRALSPAWPRGPGPRGPGLALGTKPLTLT